MATGSAEKTTISGLIAGGILPLQMQQVAFPLQRKLY
jgi:hypothetical protein